LGLSVPLHVREQQQLIQQKEVEQKNMLRSIEQQVVDAYVDSENYSKAIDVAQEAVAYAEESYRLADGRYKAGLGINLDILNAETSLYDARTKLIQAYLNYNQSEVQLLQALGEISPDTLLQGFTLSNTPISNSSGSSGQKNP
jgi:outer membrane protein TolC